MGFQTQMSGRAWAELALLSLVWGGSFVAVRVSLDEVGVVTSVFHRVFWASIALWLVVAALRLPLPRAASVWMAFGVMGLLNNVIPFTLMTWGQLHIESGLTAVLNASTAVFGVLVAACAFADERLSLRRAVGVALGFGGVCMAIGFDALASFDPRALAQMAVLAGAFSYAMAGAWARARLSHLPPQVAAAGMLTASSLTLLPVLLWREGVPSLALETDTLVAIGYYALLSTALAYLLYYRVLAMAGAGNLLLCTLLIPPVAIVLGAWLRDETLAPQVFAGFALLAVGLLILDGRILQRVTQRSAGAATARRR